MKKILLSRGAAFSPTDIASLVIGYESDHTRFQERTGASATTPATANNDPIGTSVSKYGQVRYLVTDGDTKRPLNITNQINGLPVMRFDGSNDWLATAAFDSELSQPNTAIAVLKCLNDPPAQNYAYDGIDILKRTALLAHETGSTNRKIIFAGGVDGSYWNPTLPESAFVINVAIFNGASSVAYENGGTPITFTVNSPDATHPGNNAMTGLTLGARYAGDQNGNWDVAAIYIFNAALNAVQLNQMGAYIKAKYGTDVTWNNVS